MRANNIRPMIKSVSLNLCMKRWQRLVFRLLPVVFKAFSVAPMPASDLRQSVNFNRDWKFQLGDAGGAEAVIFDDAMWNDIGLPHTTLTRYLALLETVFLVHRLPAWSRNLGQRLVKAPKLHLADAGLSCHLLGVDALKRYRGHLREHRTPRTYCRYGNIIADFAKIKNNTRTLSRCDLLLHNIPH